MLFRSGGIGYADSSTAVTNPSRLSLLLRMAPDGFFDVRRGDGYAALKRLPYEAQTPYHVRMRVDLGARTYSVWVQPPGASEVLLADQFAFGSDAPPIDDLGQVALTSPRFDKAFRVSQHTVRAEASTPGEDTPSPTPTPEPEPTPGPTPEPIPEGVETERGSGGKSASGCSALPGSSLVAAGVLPWLLWTCMRRPERPTVIRSSSPAAPTGRTAPR